MPVISGLSDGTTLKNAFPPVGCEFQIIDMALFPEATLEKASRNLYKAQTYYLYEAGILTSLSSSVLSDVVSTNQQPSQFQAEAQRQLIN